MRSDERSFVFRMPGLFFLLFFFLTLEVSIPFMEICESMMPIISVLFNDGYWIARSSETLLGSGSVDRHDNQKILYT